MQQIKIKTSNKKMQQSKIIPTKKKLINQIKDNTKSQKQIKLPKHI